MIPLFHDFEGKRVVVVGGGPVALRKARRFSREASVTVVAPEFEDGFEELSCELVRERVDADDVDDVVEESFLVVAATDDPTVNAAIARAGDREGCLVNRADQVGEAVVPSHLESSELSLAISTRGASPTTTKYLREELTPVVDAADGMIEVQKTVRSRLKTELDDQRRRKRLLRAVVESDAVWDHLPEDRQQALSTATAIVEERR